MEAMYYPYEIRYYCLPNEALWWADIYSPYTFIYETTCEYEHDRANRLTGGIAGTIAGLALLYYI